MKNNMIEQCEFCGSEAKCTLRVVDGDRYLLCDLCYEAEGKERETD